ncbi:hypothetical protein Tco_1229080 [Tanacetum coccineum]
MALPEDHLAKFHKMTDAKEMWEAIKSRFGGNDESKKMQKYILKQQFEGFSEDSKAGDSDGEGVDGPVTQKITRELCFDGLQQFRLRHRDDKTDVLTYHKKLLAEAEKEKEEIKAKVEKWHNSFKSLNILLNSQMSARDKAGLGYGDQMNKVPPPMTGIYIPSGPDKEIDDSQFTYGPKQSKPSDSDARSSDFNSS